jgi:hypothetical protein
MDLDGLTLDDGHDGALLDGRGALEAVGVDASQELGLEVHAIERVGGFIVVGLDLAWQSASGAGMTTTCGEGLPSGTSSSPLESAMIRCWSREGHGNSSDLGWRRDVG